MERSKRTLACLLALTLLAAFACNGVLEGINVHHHCTGEDCPVCLFLAGLHRLFGCLTAALAVGLCAWAMLGRSLAGAAAGYLSVGDNTPVSRFDLLLC